MTSFTWSSGASGFWTSAIYWTVSGAPTALSPGSGADNTDSATISAAGAVTVAASDYPDIVTLAIAGPSDLLLVQGGLAVEGTVDNAGTIRIAPNATMTAGNLGEPAFGAFLNTGIIDVQSGATFSLFCPTTTAAIGDFARDTGTVVLAGEIDNNGAVIAASAFGNLSLSGDFVGGIIRNDGTSMHILNQVPQGDGYAGPTTFNGVTFQGTLAPLGPLSITGGFTLESFTPGARNTIDLTGTSAIAGLPPIHAMLTALDAETLDNVSIILGALQSVTTLTLGAGATINNAGTGFMGGSGAFLSNATITNSGFLAINNAASFVNQGVLDNLGGSITDDNGGTLVNTGTILLAGGQLTAPVTGAGTLEMSANATAELTGRYGTQVFGFAGNSILLRLDQPGGSNTALGFRPGDTIALANTPASVAFANGTLTVSNASFAIASFLMPDQPANAQFQTTPTSDGGTFITEITETIACFATGTAIATSSGEVPVEHLCPGDVVTLADGGAAPIIWIGRRRLACLAHPRPYDVQPVRIAAHAFAPNQPSRPLRLSPDHAVFWRGVLVPVRCLVNATTIVQEQVHEITYLHVELETHGIILANGLPCETYLDTGNRTAFANTGGLLTLHADFAPGLRAARAYAPLTLHGPRVAALRQHLSRRAAARARTRSTPHVRHD